MPVPTTLSVLSLRRAPVEQAPPADDHSPLPGVAVTAAARTDLCVDGTPLATMLAKLATTDGHDHCLFPMPFDRVSVIDEAWPHRSLAVLRGLLRTTSDEGHGFPYIPPDRLPLYMCDNDGDITCGAVTLRLSGHDGVITWEDLRLDNGFEDDHIEHLEGVTPVHFHEESYRATLEPLMHAFEHQVASLPPTPIGVGGRLVELWRRLRLF